MKTNKLNFPRQFRQQKSHLGFHEFLYTQNGLRVLFYKIEGTNVVSTNITYLVGSKDEVVGQTGIAHMLEHMMFKPTQFDLAKKRIARSMIFEKSIGARLNANTWNDRTTYYFSYSSEHIGEALAIEAERMTGLKVSDKELIPERNNVLSEYDMYNSEPEFALACALSATAFWSHPYKNETIGFREDISQYTAEKLTAFYKDFYRPDNAVLTVVGDIDLYSALEQVDRAFKSIPKQNPRQKSLPVIEPKQEGLRRTEVVRKGTVNLLGIGVKHASFPSLSWYETMVAFEILAGGSNSFLQQNMVDKGIVTDVSYHLSPTKEPNLAYLQLTLNDKYSALTVEKMVFKLINEINPSFIKEKLVSLRTQLKTQQVKEMDSSLLLAMTLTEYISAGEWTIYFSQEELLKQIKPQSVIKLIANLFKDNNVTIASYRSTK